MAATREDERRSRLLHRYLQPIGYVEQANRYSTLKRAPDAPSSPDAVLTALSQLACLRLNAKRAIISVVDIDATYTLAEGTQSLNLIDTHGSAPGDGLFIGCAVIARSETLCQNVIALPTEGHPHPLFTVPDLTKDDRFKNMPIVTGGSGFRFYAGTPLVTEQGISIGAVAAFDNSPRDGLSHDETEFLVYIGKCIMDQLELKRQAEERLRVVRMSKGLNAFIEGKTRIVEAEPHIGNTEEPSLPTDPNPVSIKRDEEGSSDSAERPKILADEDRSTSHHSESSDFSEQSPDLGEQLGAGAERRPAEDEYRRTLSRAANLLHECFHFQEDGGIVFFETTAGFSASEEGSQHSSEEQGLDQHVSPDSILIQANTETDTVPSKVLAAAPRNTLHTPKSQQRTHPFVRPVPQIALQNILKRYRKGKLWTFDGEFGIVSSDDDRPVNDSQRPSTYREKGSKRRRAEADLLQSCFPGARYIIYVPLWDAALGRIFSACFCYTTSPAFPLAQEPDVNFVTAFANSTMMEISHIKTIMADQQKGDFIGSISHELRSPLHGVLASAEFLAETECDNFQKSLIETVESCGRTLLDTINHVLDFSRINAFEKTLRHNSKGSRTLGGSKLNVIDKKHKPMPGLLSIFAQTDVAAIAEEVVDSVFSGRTYSDISPADITDISPGAWGGVSSNANSALPANAGPKCLPLDIVLDIQHGDYKFLTQPGALRRVIMNIFGNSLKYTERGMILIELRTEDFHEMSDETVKQQKKILRLKITDTGKGISPSYLKTRLFTPFAQENVLAQGTGLGLSIVKSIVTMLGGSIKISSSLGVGTEVDVSMPMSAVATENGSSESLPIATIAQNEAIDKIRQLRTKKRVGVFGFDCEIPAEAEMHRVLQAYVTEWYGMKFIPQWEMSGEVDIIIIDERKVPTLLHTHPDVGPVSLVVLCSNLVRRSLPKLPGDKIEYVTKPPGPFKLARAIRTSVEKMSVGNGTRHSAGKTQPLARKPKSGLEAYETSLAANQEAMQALSLEVDPFPASEVPEVADSAPPLQRSPGPTSQVSANDIPLMIDQITAITTPAYEGPPTIASSPRLQRHQGDAGTETISGRKGGKPRILLVDDNAINLRLLQMFMKKKKYEEVDTAENGLLAFQAAERKRYDVIFMDLSMPVMDGFESTRAIRKLEREQRERKQKEDSNPYFAAAEEEYCHDALVVALTGLASSRDQIEASDCGINIFMTKPVSFKSVGAILDDWHGQCVGKGEQ